MQKVLYDRRSMIHPRALKDRIHYSWWDLFLGSSFDMENLENISECSIQEGSEIISPNVTLRKRKRRRSSGSMVSSNASVGSEPTPKKTKRPTLSAIFMTPVKPVLRLNRTLRQNTVSKCERLQEAPRRSFLRRSCSMLRSSTTLMGPPPTPTAKHQFSSLKIRVPKDSEQELRLTRSWSQSVASLNKATSISKREMKRQEAIFELYSGEVNIVKDLEMIKHTYRDAIISLQILTEEEAHQIFGDTDTLLNLHKELRDKLFALRNTTGCVETIGEAILSWIPGFQSYNSYCLNHARAKEALEEKKKSSKRFRDFLQRCLESPFSRRQELWSLLDEPRSKMVKYPILVKEILGHTLEDHEDKKLLPVAISLLEQALQMSDKFFGLGECRHIVSCIVCPSSLENEELKTAAAVLSRGELKDDRGNKYYCFLFNIGLVISRLYKMKEGKYFMKFPLFKALELSVDESVMPPKGSKNSPGHLFEVRSMSHSIILKADEVYVKKYWVDRIKKLIQSAQCGEGSAQRPLVSPQSSTSVPENNS